MKISKTLPNLINGVSQQPPRLRLDSQCELQENAFNSVVRGMSKRPGTEHVARLEDGSSVINGADDLFFHANRVSNEEAYHVVIGYNPDQTPLSTRLMVFDKEGIEKSVTTSAEAHTYLQTVTPSKSLRSVSNADFTFILNTETVVQKAALRTPVINNPTALVYVRQGDYLSEYKVSFFRKGGVDDGTLIGVMEYVTPDNSDPSNRRLINPTHIVEQLHACTESTEEEWLFELADFPITGVHDNLSGLASGVNLGFFDASLIAERKGASILVTSNTGEDFRVEITDSSGGSHLFAHKETV